MLSPNLAMPGVRPFISCFTDQKVHLISCVSRLNGTLVVCRQSVVAFVTCQRYLSCVRTALDYARDRVLSFYALNELERR